MEYDWLHGAGSLLPAEPGLEAHLKQIQGRWRPIRNLKWVRHVLTPEARVEHSHLGQVNLQIRS